MPEYLPLIAAFFAALLAVCWIHPKLVKIARVKKIVDNPNSRKLQKDPIPILGGTAIFFGIILGLTCAYGLEDISSLFLVLTVSAIVYYVGFMDDILSLSPKLRFLIEIFAVCLLIFIGDYKMDNLHGIWGVYQIPDILAVPLTVYAAVGIINAINLIDGVDGLASGFCTLACLIFGILFFLAGDSEFGILAFTAAGALIPFFFHNVFGKTSKMFIGDSGTLLLGMILAIFVIRVLQTESPVSQYIDNGRGVVALTLSILAIPVFDTIRVMSARMLKGTSPFNPDKTHLHHLFIEIGFSHAGTTFCILTLNSLVVATWAILYTLKAPVDLQLYVILGLSLFLTVGFYFIVKRQQAGNTIIYRALRKLGYLSHLERKGGFVRLQTWLDRI